MSRSILISPSVSLVDEVVQHLVSEKGDYSSNLVVFPGKRPAHFLRKALGELEGRSYIPPAIYSFDRFIDVLFETSPSAPPALTPVEAAVVLFEIHKALPERIGGEEFSTLERFLPMGLRIFDELEELTMSCQPVKRIVPLLQAVPLRGLHSLGSLYQQFYPEVERLGYSTRATRYVASIGNTSTGILEKFPVIVLAGMFAFSEAERRLVQTLAERPQTILVFQDGPGMRPRITELGLAVEERGRKAEPPVIDFIAAPDSHGEVFSLANRFLELQESGEKPDHRSVVLVPDPAILPALVHHALSLLDEPYNISIGYPHSRSPIAGFLTSLMTAVSTRHDGKFQGSEYLKVVLHPFVKGIRLQGKSHDARVLLFRLEEGMLEGRIPQYFRLEELETQDELFNQVASVLSDEGMTPEQLRDHLHWIHEKIFLPATIEGSVGECAQKLTEVLYVLAGAISGRQHTLFRPSLESILSVLGALSQSLVSRVNVRDQAATFSIISKCINEERIPLPGTPVQGLQILGFLETRNLRFDHVYVLNANEEHLPGEPGRYSLIPTMVRANLGLATRKDHEAVASYYFSVLLSGAKRVTLLFTDSDSKTPSRYVEQLLWKVEQLREREVQPVSMAAYQVQLSHRKPQPIQKTPEVVEAVKGIRFSATAIDTYLKCGIKFYYGHVLQLVEKEELEIDVNRKDLGSMVHRVLSEFSTPFVGNEIDVKKMNPESMKDLVDSVFRREFGEEEFGNKYLMKIQVRNHLSEFVRSFEIPRLSGRKTRVLGVETSLSAEKNGFRFKGRVDRLEEAEGVVVVHDYKIGGNKLKLAIRPHLLDPDDRKTWSKAVGSLQLPFYVLLVSEGMGKDRSVLPSYILLGKGAIDKAMEVPLFDPPGIRDTLYPQLEQLMFRLLNELADVTTPFEPPVDLQENCPYCPFTHLCGTEWVKRKGNF